MASTAAESKQFSGKSKQFQGSHKNTTLNLLNEDRTSSENFCDVTIKVNGQQYLAHKCVIGTLSKYFKQLFQSEMKQDDCVVNIVEIGNATMKLVLDFVYTGMIVLTEENVKNILIASNFLQMNDLKQLCATFLSETLNKANCLEMKVQGELFNSPALTVSAETFAMENFKDVLRQPQFKSLDKKHAMAFLSTPDQNTFGSREVYEGVLSWVYHDLNNRKKDFPDLFKLVKLHLLPAAYLENEVGEQELVKQSHQCKDYLQSELLCRLKLLGNKPQTSKEDVQHERERQRGDSPVLKENASKKKNRKANKAKPSTKPASDGTSTQSTSQVADAKSDDIVSLSKEFVRILRHGKYADLQINTDGFVNVVDILNHKTFKKKFGSKSLKCIRKVVHAPGKKRFELRKVEDQWKIRAISGHSIPVYLDENDVAEDIYEEETLSTSSDSTEVIYPGNDEVSKELVRILRHGRYHDVEVDSSGYASVEKILSSHRFQNFCGRLTLHDVEYVVETGDRRYFELARFGAEWKIKALHGHTLEVGDLDLTPITGAVAFRFVHHATTQDAWVSIQQNGLSRMERNHIHFTPGIPLAGKSSHQGKPNADIAVVVDIVEAMKNGLKFYSSSNDVVLCPGDWHGRIPVALFSHVIRLRPVWKRIL